MYIKRLDLITPPQKYLNAVITLIQMSGTNSFVLLSKTYHALAQVEMSIVVEANMVSQKAFELNHEIQQNNPSPEILEHG